MIDTLTIARQKHPGAKHTLDALCTRFGIDRSHRVLHGALLDAQLLAQVYVELTGGRQIGLTPGRRCARGRDPSRRAATRRTGASGPRVCGQRGGTCTPRSVCQTLSNPLWGQREPA